MTQYDLWTMDSKRLVKGFENACIGVGQGKANAPKAVEVLGREILRRLQILEEECVEE